MIIYFLPLNSTQHLRTHIKRPCTRVITYFLLCLTPFLLAPMTSASDYEFASIENLIEQRVGAEVLRKIYKNLDIDITVTPMKAERAELEATAGLKDGEALRIFNYGNEHPSVIRVPTSYYQLNTMAFFKAGNSVSIKSISDLKRYRVAYIKGVKHTDAIIEQLGNKVRDVDNTTEMMRLINNGRIDIGIISRADGLNTIKELGLTTIDSIKQPLSTLNLYHYLHISNTDLVEPVNNMIVNMKDSGTLQKLIEETRNRLINQ